jgi:hypothetical protein
MIVPGVVLVNDKEIDELSLEQKWLFCNHPPANPQHVHTIVQKRNINNIFVIGFAPNITPKSSRLDCFVIVTMNDRSVIGPYWMMTGKDEFRVVIEPSGEA